MYALPFAFFFCRPEECLSVSEAIDLYTRNGAYTTMQEHQLGLLLPGYLADFVVVEAVADVCQLPQHLLTARVAEVWVGGQQKL